MPMLPSVIEDTAERVAAFEAALAAALSTRVVAPGFAPSSLRTAEELAAGVVNVTLRDEGDYGQGRGTTARGATTRLDLICHLQVASPANCSRSALASAVRAAELSLLEEVKAFCRSRPIPGIEVLLTEAAFSQQLEAPLGWAVITIELKPPVAATH